MGPLPAPRLKKVYLDSVVPKLKEQFGYKTVMQVPRLDKIVVNMGVGEATQNTKMLDPLVRDLGEICGQKPVVTTAEARDLRCRCRTQKGPGPARHLAAA